MALEAKIALGAVRATLTGGVALLVSALLCNLTSAAAGAVPVAADAAPVLDGQRAPAVMVAAASRAMGANLASAGKTAPLTGLRPDQGPGPGRGRPHSC